MCNICRYLLCQFSFSSFVAFIFFWFISSSAFFFYLVTVPLIFCQWDYFISLVDFSESVLVLPFKALCNWSAPINCTGQLVEVEIFFYYYWLTTCMCTLLLLVFHICRTCLHTALFPLPFLYTFFPIRGTWESSSYQFWAWGVPEYRELDEEYTSVSMWFL